MILNKIRKLYERLFGVNESDLDVRNIKQLIETNRTLDKFGGTLVSRGRSLHTEFKTKEGERRYQNHIRKKFEEKCRKAGYDDVQDFINRN